MFVIVEENHGFADAIGNPAAPNLNALAARYGIATNYFGVAHPSEPNYVGLLGGDTFGVADDNPYHVNRVAAPSLISQLDATSDGPLVEHWDGRQWSVVPVAAAGGAVLDAVTVRGGEMWAVGQTDNATAQARPLIVHVHNGHAGSSVLGTTGSSFSNMTGVAATDQAVWAVGTFFDATSGNQRTLVLRHDGGGWHTVPAPSPGTGDAILGAVAASGDDVWAVGTAETDSNDALVERHHG
jgi:hypothetical protein